MRIPTWTPIIGILALAGAAAAADKPASLLSNGDFETTSGITAVDWPMPTGTSLEVEKGNHFLRLTAGGPGKSVTVYRQIPVDQAKALRISWRVRWDGVKRGAQPWHDARIVFDFKDADGKALKPNPGHPFYTGSGGWIEKSIDVAVPTGAEVISLMPAIFEAESGTLDVDDFTITAIPLDQVGAKPDHK